MTWRIGTVISTGKAWRGARELEVTLDRPLPGHPEDDPEDGGAPATVRALAYTDLVGDPAPGDALLLNVSALARGLGTGGYALVVGPASPGTTLPPDPAPGPGHLVKARYTPCRPWSSASTNRNHPTTPPSPTPTTCTACPSSSPTCTPRCPPSSPDCATPPAATPSRSPTS
nr:hypothetical protein GCM10025730_04030 [Promicromonospora thailandica]